MTMFHQLAAVAMSEARSNLQRLKHADACTGHEREEIVGLLEAVEGSLVLVSRVTWLGVEECSLDDLRERLVLVALSSTATTRRLVSETGPTSL